MSFPYPPQPWSDGQEVIQLQSDGTILTATYRAVDNVWDMVRSNPDAGDQGYITDQQVLLVPRIDTEGGVEPASYTAAFAELNDRADRPVLTQYQLNDESLYTHFNHRRRQTRARTTTDFIQSTVNEGEWTYDENYQENELPSEGKFALFDSAGSPVNQWIAVSKITINGTGRNTEKLEDVRRGAIFNIFDVILNSFGQFVVENVEFIGNPNAGQFWLRLDVAPVYGRAAGSIPPGTVAEIQVIQQRPCIVSDTTTPPLVNNSGFLWYSEVSRKLYVSNWSSLNGPNGHSSWIASDWSDIVKTVTYYASPQSVNSQDGSIGGSGTDWFLSPQAIYIRVGDKVQIADEEYAYVVSFEQKDDAPYPYTAMVLDRPITPPVVNGEITHIHLPYEGSDQDTDGEYLPLTGGTLQGTTGGYLLEANKLDSNRLFSIFTSSAGTPTSDVTEYWKAPADITKPFEITTKAYVDLAVANSGGGDYLPLTGGELTGDLNVNDVLIVEGDEASYNKNRTGISQLGQREIVNGGILSNVMLNPTDGYLAGFATEQYVDDKFASSGGSSQVAFTYTQSNEEPDSGNIAGKFGLTDDSLNSVLDFDDAKVIWFSATDFDGNKPFHSWTRDVSTYAPGPLYLLRNNEMQWMLQGGAAAGGGVYIEYSKDFDVFLLWWTGTQVSARLGDFSGLTNGGLYDLYIPNLTKI